MEYINEVFDNYYNISLDDRIELIDRISAFHEEHKYEFYYDYSTILKVLNMVNVKTFQAKRFKEFYTSLDDLEKIEFEKQVRNISDMVKDWKWMDIPMFYEDISPIFDLNIDIKKQDNKELYIVDFTRFEEELRNKEEIKNTNFLDSERIIDVFCKKYYYYAFDKIRYNGLSKERKESILEVYSKPLIMEFNNSIIDCISLIREDLNMDTRNSFNQLDNIKKIYVIFELLDIDRTILNYKEIGKRRIKYLNY